MKRNKRISEKIEKNSIVERNKNKKKIKIRKEKKRRKRKEEKTNQRGLKKWRQRMKESNKNEKLK